MRDRQGEGRRTDIKTYLFLLDKRTRFGEHQLSSCLAKCRNTEDVRILLVKILPCQALFSLHAVAGWGDTKYAQS